MHRRGFKPFEQGRILASPWDAKITAGGFRGCRCAQPPATIYHPFGMAVGMAAPDFVSAMKILEGTFLHIFGTKAGSGIPTESDSRA